MIKNLLSRKNGWKTAAVGISAAALVLGLSFANPFATESVHAEDANTTQNVSEVKAAMESGEIEVMNITIDYEFTHGNTTPSTEPGLTMSCGVDEQAAIEIAKADTGVQELLAAGASLGNASTLCTCGTIGNVATGETEITSETLVMVAINGIDDSYTAYIDLAEGKVTKVVKTVNMAPPSPEGESFFSTPDLAQG